jgi:hypothetical protein
MFNRVMSELIQAGTKRSQSRALHDHPVQQFLEVMRKRCDPQVFLEDCLEVFLHCLLAMKTGGIIQARLYGAEDSGGPSILFCLADPAGCCSFHKGAALWS